MQSALGLSNRLIVTHRALSQRPSRVWSSCGGAALALMLALPDTWKYPWALLPATIFFAGPTLIPALAPRSHRVLSPHNWALTVLFTCTVIVPVLVIWKGPARGVLPILPDDAAIGFALRLQAGVLVAFLAGLVSWKPASGAPVEVSAPESASLGQREIALLALTGLAGLWLIFGSVEGLFRYLSNPAEYAAASSDPSARKALSLILRPFLIFAGIGWWSRRVVQRRAGGLCVAETAVTVFAIVIVGIHTISIVPPLWFRWSPCLVRTLLGYGARRFWSCSSSLCADSVPYSE